MLYKILDRTIRRYFKYNNEQAILDIKQKLDVFLAANKITNEQYEELVTLIQSIELIEDQEE